MCPSYNQIMSYEFPLKNPNAIPPKATVQDQTKVDKVKADNANTQSLLENSRASGASFQTQMEIAVVASLMH